jgi:hypothetical protein
VANATAAASFGCSVSVVVLLRTEEQMVGVAARWIVTVVKDPEAVGDGAVRELPSEAMRGTVVPDRVVPDGTVASGQSAAGP